jgi:hypothetical protein
MPGRDAKLMLQRKPTTLPAATTCFLQTCLSCRHTTARLLSLPEEIITRIYIFAGENTRTLVRLSAVNRCLRAIWLQDSDCIIAQKLELKAPGDQDAIALTLMEACCTMPVSGFHRVNAPKDDLLLRLHRPGLMRNVDLASTVCTKSLEWHSSTYRTGPLPIETFPYSYYSM